MSLARCTGAILQEGRHCRSLFVRECVGQAHESIHGCLTIVLG